MTFAATGSPLYAATGTLPVSNQGTGNLLLVEVITDSATEYCSSLSGGGATWTQMGTVFHGTVNAYSATLFAGTVTATGAGTVTPSFTGGTPSYYELDGHEFTSTVGAWALDVQGNLDSAGTNNWASLTPANNGELYFGAAACSNSGGVAGSTSGYTYSVNANGDSTAYNASCPAGTATYPVWGGAAYQVFGSMVLVMEQASGTNTSPAYATTYDTTAVSGTGTWVNPATPKGRRTAASRSGRQPRWPSPRSAPPPPPG